MLTFTTLASGSGGNAALVSCGDTHLLLDAGISAKQITAGLAALGVAPRDLTAILITHEHSDHVSGLRVLSKRAAAPIYATGPTCRCLYDRNTGSEAADLLRVMEAGTGVQLGGLWVQSFPTPHDAAGSVGYILSGEGGRIVLATDLGYITPAVKTAVQDCGLLICEANHDEDWVRSGPYPYHLKARILGDRGHLSNEAGAELAALAPAPVPEEAVPPAAVPTDAELHGIDVLDLEAAVHCLWRNGIYAEAAMGCTGPVIKLPARSREAARQLLTAAGHL